MLAIVPNRTVVENLINEIMIINRIDYYRTFFLVVSKYYIRTNQIVDGRESQYESTHHYG